MKKTPLTRKTPLAPGDKKLKRTELKSKQPPDAPQKPRKPIARSSPPQKHPRPAPLPEELPGPLSPGEWRKEVWRRCGGLCVMTGIAVPRDADHWIWHCHHPVPKQALAPQHKYDPRNGIVLIRRAHERHESVTERVPAEKLPVDVFIFAKEMGGTAEARLLRQHPGTRPRGF